LQFKHGAVFVSKAIIAIGDPIRMPGMFDRVDCPTFVTALGLIHWAMNHERQSSSHNTVSAVRKRVHFIVQPLQNIKKRVLVLFEKFFP